MEELINDKVRVKFALVIDKNGQNLGVLDIGTARELASRDKLDIVLVQKPAPGKQAIVKIMDYHKAKFEKAKHSKKPTEIQQKEIQFNVEIAERDLTIHANKFRKWCAKGKVRAMVRIKIHGRFADKPDYVMGKWVAFTSALEGVKYKVDRKPEFTERDLIAYIQNY